VTQNVDSNRKHWEKICQLIHLRRGGSSAQMTMEEVLALDDENEREELHASLTGDAREGEVLHASLTGDAREGEERSLTDTPGEGSGGVKKQQVVTDNDVEPTTVQENGS
jgi:hypothetical protein